MMRIGFGFDLHPLVGGRSLVLGGIQIPWEKGLKGHSDGDVVLHAIGDALLGAAGAGDLGDHFSDKDKTWKGISSEILLKKIMKIVMKSSQGKIQKRVRKLENLDRERSKKQGGIPLIQNIDVTIVAEEPKLGLWKKTIRDHIASMLHLQIRQVNIKAKTMEGLGPIGQGKAIACYAVVLLSLFGNQEAGSEL